MRPFFHWWKKVSMIKHLPRKGLLLFGFQVITTKYEFCLQFQTPRMNFPKNWHRTIVKPLFIFYSDFQTIFYINFWKNWFCTVFCFSSPFPSFPLSLWFFGLVDWAGKIPWTNPSNIELDGGGELFLTGRRGEVDILEVWKMIYFHINP